MQPEEMQELLAKAAEMGAASALAKLQRGPALPAGTSAVGNAQPVGHSAVGAEYSDELAAFTAEPTAEDLHQEVCGLSTGLAS